MFSRDLKQIFIFFLTLLFLIPVCVNIEAADKIKSENIKQDNSETGYLSPELSKMENPRAAESPGLFSTLFNLFISLLIVIALIYIIMIIIKYFYIRASIPIKSEGVIKVIAKEYLDSKKCIYAIDFADRIILVGGGTETLSFLAEIKDPETVTKVKERADEYISKYRMKEELKFSEEIKNAYIRQGKQAIDSGNKAVRNFMERLKGGPKNEDK